MKFANQLLGMIMFIRMNLYAATRVVIIGALTLILSGCFTSDEPLFPVDDKIMTPLLPENAMIYFNGYAGLRSYSGKVWKKEGSRATYESEEFDDIMFLKHVKGGILSQFRRKSDNRIFYLCFSSYGNSAPSHYKINKGFHTWFAYMQFTDYHLKGRFSIIRKDGYYDIKSLGNLGLNPCLSGSTKFEMVRDKRKDSSGYVLDMDTDEGRILNDRFIKNIKTCDRIICDIETDDERWVHQLRPQIRKAALSGGCLLGGAAYKGAQQSAKGSHPLRMEYDPESGCRFFGLGIVQYRLDIGAIDVRRCKSGKCLVYYAIDCTAGSGIGYEACGKSRHLRADLKASVDIRGKDAVFLGLEK